MGSTGIPSYSTSPIENETTDGNVTWKEGQLPSTVNNSKRQALTDLRNAFNDLPWFDYGTGTQDTDTHLGADSVYVSATAFYIEGADVTAVYFAGRPVRATGSTTGTIYGVISSSSYDSGTTRTTVNVSWNSGTLQNETIATAILMIPGLALANAFEIVCEKDGDGIAEDEGHDAYVAWAFMIYGYVIQAKNTGDIVFDIWVDDFATDSPPTVADTITASAKPTLDGQQQVSSTTLTGWTTVFPSNQAVRVNIDSVSGISRYTLTLLCRRV